MTYTKADTSKGMLPREGFYVQFINQPHKGMLHHYDHALKMALVSFQTDINEWGQPELCDIADLLLWTEGLKPIRTLNPCIVMFGCWKGPKCNTCPYQDNI